MLLVSGTNALGVAASFLSLQYVSVPTYGMLKRASIVFTMMFDWWLHERKPSTAILHSVAIMAVGALLMGFTDLSFSFIGYAAGIASSAFQSLFLVLSNKYFSDQHLSAMDSAKVHCAASVPAHALLFLLSTEPSEMLSPATWSNPGFASCFAASCVLGVALIASTQICSLVNTPLTVVVTGNAKSVGQALLGILLFGSRHPPLNVLGIVIGFLGSFYYAKSKWDEQQSRARSKVTS
jgi:drug/metabolite transporter (DMT)-like permease